MNTVATNIRFPANEYEELKTLAFLAGKSAAQVIREAVKEYKAQHMKTAKKQISLAEKFRKISVKIDVSTLDLIREGRRFE